ncbi:MAG: hypothetical protein GXO67_01055 [Archaeoglobi archaeon]|nr:hypothetical protein [Archaeoglobi archaeon]
MRVGITLISVFLLFMFSVSAFTAFSILLAGDQFAKAFREEMEKYGAGDVNPEDFIPLAVAVGFAFSLAYLIAGIGLLMRKEWGRKLAILIAIIHVIYGIMAVAIPEVGVPNLLIGGAILLYLRRKDVRAEFVQEMTIEERVLGRRLD